MGMIFKSAIGLGAVYFAMFAPVVHNADVVPAAGLCASAARAQFEGDSSLRAQWTAAGCAVKLAEQAQRVANVTPARPAPPPPKPPKPAPPAPPPQKAISGTLTEGDLAEPWFGPARALKKSARRG